MKPHMTILFRDSSITAMKNLATQLACFSIVTLVKLCTTTIKGKVFIIFHYKKTNLTDSRSI